MPGQEVLEVLDRADLLQAKKVLAIPLSTGGKKSPDFPAPEEELQPAK